MSDTRYELEKLITRHAKPGSSWSIDAWPIGGTHPQRFTVSADWLRENEPAVERVTIQGVPSKERGWEELLAALATMLRELLDASVPTTAHVLISEAGHVELVGVEGSAQVRA